MICIKLLFKQSSGKQKKQKNRNLVFWMESQKAVVALQGKNTLYLSECRSSVFLSYNLKLILIKSDNIFFSLA